MQCRDYTNTPGTHFPLSSTQEASCFRKFWVSNRVSVYLLPENGNFSWRGAFLLSLEAFSHLVIQTRFDFRSWSGSTTMKTKTVTSRMLKTGMSSSDSTRTRLPSCYVPSRWKSVQDHLLSMMSLLVKILTLMRSSYLKQILLKCRISLSSRLWKLKMRSSLYLGMFINISAKYFYTTRQSVFFSASKIASY